MFSRRNKPKVYPLQFIAKELRTLFVTGLFLLLPALATMWVLIFLFNMLDGITGNFIYNILGRKVWGLGFITTFIFIITIGLLTRNIVGKSVFKVVEDYLAKIPLVSNIYTSSKQIVEAVSMQNKSAFKKVAMVEYPRRDMYALGFITNEKDHGLKEKDTGKNVSSGMISVFLPTSPNPTSGYFVLVPQKDVKVLDISVEAGFKMIMSGGLLLREANKEIQSISSTV